MTFNTVTSLLIKVVLITAAVIITVMIVDQKQYRKENWKYEEVYRINEVHKPTLNALGIEEVFYYDWEETANSLDVPVDSLTLNMFIKHLLHHEDN